MPIFEYRCEDCGEVSEFIIMGKNEPLACKKCGSGKLAKMLSAHNVASSSTDKVSPPPAAGCCGNPHSCGSPGSCCSE